LDQRYLDPAEHKTTRNVLVASHFGLELSQKLQGSIPPFRSVYQTALYYGCLKAVHDWGAPLPGISPGEANIALNGTPKPLVFEIGQSRAYRLTNPGGEGIHPGASWRSGFEWPKARAILCIVTVLLLLVVTLHVNPKKLFSDSLLLAGTIFTLLAAMVIFFLASYDHADVRGEPFSLIEGISNWPTLAVRMGVILFCTFAIVQARHADKRNFDELNRIFQLGPTGQAETTDTGAVALEAWLVEHSMVTWKGRYRYQGAITAVLAVLFCACAAAGLFEWSGGVRPGNWPPDDRLLVALTLLLLVIFGCVAVAWSQTGFAVALDVALYLCFLWGLSALFPPPADPYRGWLNRLVSMVVLVTAIFLSISLLWSAIRATRQCIKLEHLVMNELPNWSRGTQLNSAAKLGLDPLQVNSKDPAVCQALNRSLKELLNVQFIARRSALIDPLIYEAAFAYLLLFLSRSPFFDQYVMSWFLILVFTVALLGVLGSAVWLRFAAFEARRTAKDRIRANLDSLRENAAADGRQPPQTATEALEKIETAVAAINAGAFSPLGENPVLRAAAIVLGGIGALLSLQPIQQLLR
jgi:hypothetical protein